MNLAAAALGLALVGLVDSLYFTLAYYGRVRAERIVPTTNSEGTCQSILDTPYARVMGLPNSVFGLVYYGVVVVSATYRLLSGEWIGILFLAAISIFSAVLSLYLAWSLLFRLHVVCPLCFLAQGINLALAVIFVLSV